MHLAMIAFGYEIFPLGTLDVSVVSPGEHAFGALLDFQTMNERVQS